LLFEIIPSLLSSFLLFQTHQKNFSLSEKKKKTTESLCFFFLSQHLNGDIEEESISEKKKQVSENIPESM
jgi:hypothetical protein